MRAHLYNVTIILKWDFVKNGNEMTIVVAWNSRRISTIVHGEESTSGWIEG